MNHKPFILGIIFIALYVFSVLVVTEGLRVRMMSGRASMTGAATFPSVSKMIVGINYWSGYTKQDFIDKDLSLLKDAGIQTLRIGFTGTAENLNNLKTLVPAITGNGINVLGILIRTDLVPSNNLNAWGDWVYSTVNEFKNNVHVWEIWNEPNWNTGFGSPGDPIKYTQFLKAAYPKAKQADPSCTVIGGSILGADSAGQNFLKSMYDNGAKNYMDVVALHPYCDPESPKPPNQDKDGKAFWKVQNMHDIMASYGDGSKKIWITEMGWRTDRVSEATQATYLQQALGIAENWEYVDNSIIYCWTDGGAGPYGLLTIGRSIKPSFYAVKDFIKKCSDGTVYDQCSATKPKYCSSGTLIDKCSTCGCSAGTCQADGTCSACSSLSYPSDKWQRIWYTHSTGACLGNIPDQTSSTFDNNWALGIIAYSKTDDIEFRSSRTINFPTAGNYTFTVGSDDGVRLWIDDVLKIDKWVIRSYTTDSVTLNLTAGNHKLRLDYFENLNAARVSFNYIRTCSDGTAFNSCSAVEANKPSWCDSSGNLIPNQCGASYHNCLCPTSASNCNADGSCSSQANSLISYWKFDEGTGTVANDSTTNKNKGTLVNSPTWVTGKKGKALQFNGTNNYVNVPHSSSLNLSSKVTIAAWINPTSTTAWSRIVAKSHTSNTNPYTIYGLLFDDANHIRLEIASNSSHVGVNGSTAIPLNTWTYVVGTYDGSTMKVYVNGNLDSSVPQTGPIDTNTMALSIARSGYSANYYNGKIDEVKIWNRALTIDEIKKDYSANQP